jgi:hypothetical protein
MFASQTGAISERPMSSLPERRRARRYSVALPIRVVKLRSRKVDVSGESCNLSSGGALFVMAGAPPVEGSEIEFRVTMRGSALLHCRGRVARIEETVGAETFGIAATIDRYRFIRPEAG